MSEEAATVWKLGGTRVVVLADCHIHPGGGPAFPPALFSAMAAPDLIVTLGDMGESAGLDQLAEIAPVVGVRGADDSDDPRTDQKTLVLSTGETSIGCVFDAVAAGLGASSYPFVPVADFAAAAERVFGRGINMLLHASTHRSEEALVDGVLIFNPGSAVLPADGSRPSFVRMSADPPGTAWEIVHFD